jgi:hypothetical protein
MIGLGSDFERLAAFEAVEGGHCREIPVTIGERKAYAELVDNYANAGYTNKVSIRRDQWRPDEATSGIYRFDTAA